MKTKAGKTRYEAVTNGRGMHLGGLAAVLYMVLAAQAFSTDPLRAQTNRTAIPFDQIGTVAGKEYSGEGLAVGSSSDGARLRCAFQRLDGHVTTQGLWLASEVEGPAREPFRIVARTLGRDVAEELPDSGEVKVEGQLVRFVRPRLSEEYTVSVDGIRQDFVIEKRPAGNGAVRLALEVNGAKARAVPQGARLELADEGRRLIYNRLKAQDARGRELKARMEVLSAGRLVVVLDDTGAEYPVRIDPTFSDANWVSLGGLPGVDAGVYAAVTDGHGNLYIGGQFLATGGCLANGVAKWNGRSWSSLGSGMSRHYGPSIFALAVSGTNLYAGGVFDSAGGVAATNIAQWNGSSWSAMGSGIDGGIRSLAVVGDTLYAGGDFTVIGGVPAKGLAQWDGSSWKPVGSGLSGGYVGVNALAVSGNNLYVGGYFTAAGGVAATNIAKWDGTSWSVLGWGLYGGDEGVATLLVSGNTIYAGGWFTMAGGVPANRIAQWDGTSWSALGSGITTSGFAKVGALAMFGTNLYVLGDFDSAGGVPANYIAKWNGSSWSSLGSGLKVRFSYNSGVSALVVLSNSLYVGGQFVQAGDVPANNIAQWDGSSWSTVGSPTFSGNAASIFALAMFKDSLYVGGYFTNACGVAANNIARWNGNSWSGLGSGIQGTGSDGYGPFVFALAASSNALYVGGDFSMAGGVSANCIAQWNGSSWSALGTGISGAGANGYGPSASVLAVSGDELYVGGNFRFAGGASANYIARWRGYSWSALGGGMNDAVGSLVVSSNTLYAGGWFTTADGAPANYVAKWDGSGWSALGSGMNSSVSALAASGGRLYAAGGFTTADGTPASHIAQWDGNSWAPLGSGVVALDPLYNAVSANALAASGNTLYVAGFFNWAGGVPVSNIAQWDGNSWSSLGSGISGEASDYTQASLRVMALGGDGNLYVGGAFSAAGTNGAAFVAEALLSRSSRNLTLKRLGGGTNVITGLGTPGYSYALDLATNLMPPITWLPQVTNASPGVDLIFTNVSAIPQVIYRTRYVAQ